MSKDYRKFREKKLLCSTLQRNLGRFRSYRPLMVRHMAETWSPRCYRVATESVGSRREEKILTRLQRTDRAPRCWRVMYVEGE